MDVLDELPSAAMRKMLLHPKIRRQRFATINGVFLPVEDSMWHPSKYREVVLGCTWDEFLYFL